MRAAEVVEGETLIKTCNRGKNSKEDVVWGSDKGETLLKEKYLF